MRLYSFYIQFPKSIMSTLRTFAVVTCLSLLPSAPALAFINTDALSDSLKNIEQDLSSDATGLGGLLNELEDAAAESGASDQYLQVTVGGSATTMWDVPKTAWFYSSVLALTELGIASGYKDASGNLTGSYGPGNNVTHAEALKIALGSAGVSGTSCGAPSHPQASGHWAAGFVACAEQRDFGFTSSQGLNDTASRAEVLHYVLKAFGVTVPDGTPPFAESASHRYKNDIAYAYALEIVSGDKDENGDEKGTFRPNDPVNRAEVAKIVKLAIELL